MIENTLPTRQVHLDFHTGESIGDIGAAFDKKEFEQALINGHINSITVFAKCHHGWSYYPSKVNAPHPGLKINLLGEQLEACKQIGVRAPVYISAGFDEKEARKHPDWISRAKIDDMPSFENPGYHRLCFNSPYLDLLLAHTREVMHEFNPCEIFYDICSENFCRCKYCVEGMKKEGLNPDSDEDTILWSKKVYAEYRKKTYECVKAINPDTAVFHNGGNIPFGRRDYIEYNDHLELESLPTGGWGYDHYPMSALYASNLGKDYLGMTGKFHKSWGEFGGFKHPNALIYETCVSLALSSKCSIGDQLHPSGCMNESTYNLIGKAYSEVERKEKYCYPSRPVADIAVLAASATGENRGKIVFPSDVGANRMLLRGKYLYTFIDEDCDFSRYKLLILPDCVSLTPQSGKKLLDFLKNGGKALFTGKSAAEYIPGIRIGEQKELRPDYMQPVKEEGFANAVTQYIMYSASYKFDVEPGFKTLAYSIEPYFNRTAEHFCSHQHSPDRPGFMTKCAVANDNIAYINHDIFADYALKGELHCKELVTLALDMLLKEDKTVSVSGLPDRGMVTLQENEERGSLINHLLFAHTSIVGDGVEIIEDIIPVNNIKVRVKTDKKPSSVKLVPQEKDIEFTWENGICSYEIERLYIHQMVEIVL